VQPVVAHHNAERRVRILLAVVDTTLPLGECCLLTSA
jgi:hypothetical protein